MKYSVYIFCLFLLSGCATTPSPEKMRDFWVGENNESFVKDYSECRMKADEVGPGMGTNVMTMLIWPIGLGMAISGGIQGENTMKLCMASKGWSPK